MDTLHALEELRIADREALSIQDELERNWRSGLMWMSAYGRKSHRRGALRLRELDVSLAALHMVAARAEGAAGPGRKLPTFVAVGPSSTGAPRWAMAGRHIHAVHLALRAVHARRKWLRGAFRVWSAGREHLEPLEDISGFEAQDKKRLGGIARISARYQFMATSFWMAVVVAIVVGIYQTVCLYL